MLLVLYRIPINADFVFDYSQGFPNRAYRLGKNL